MSRLAVLAITHNGAKNLDVLKAVQAKLSKIVETEKLSSIYEVRSDFTDSRQRTDAVTFMGQSLCYVLSSVFEGDAKALYDMSKQIEKEVNKPLAKEHIQIDLLSLDNEISMLPTLTLPHPDLHRRAEFLVPTSEILPTYEHPILEQTLLQLEASKKYKGKVHFYAQSKSLVSFT